MDVSAPLFRTLASLPVESRILNLSASDSVRGQALLHLGFHATLCFSTPDDLADVNSLISGENQEVEPFICVAEAADLPFSSGTFDWVIAGSRLDYSSSEVLLRQLQECQRVVREGGWIYLIADAGERLHPCVEKWDMVFRQLKLAVAQEPARCEAEGTIHVIYRRMGESTCS